MKTLFTILALWFSVVCAWAQSPVLRTTLTTNSANFTSPTAGQIPKIHSVTGGVILWTNSVDGGGSGTTETNIFSPITYGAVGGGTVDDTSALQTMMTAANLVRYSFIELGGRLYKTTIPLKLTNLDMTIQNGGLIATTSTNLLWLANDRQRVRNMLLGGPASPSTNSIGIRVEAEGTYIQEPSLDAVKLTNMWVGLYATSAVHLVLKNCQVTACAGTNVWLQACDETWLSCSSIGMNDTVTRDMQDSGFLPSGFLTNSVGVYIYKGIGTKIDGCDINFTRQAIMAEETRLELLHSNFEDHFARTNNAVIDMTNMLSACIESVSIDPAKTAVGSNVMSAIMLRKSRLSGIKVSGLVANNVAVGVDIRGTNPDDGGYGPWLFDGRTTWRIDSSTNYIGSSTWSRYHGNAIDTPVYNTMFGSDIDRAGRAQFFGFAGGAFVTSANNSFQVQGPTFNVLFDVNNGRATAASDFKLGTTRTVLVTLGAGSPEGVLTADIGSLYLRTNGSAGTTLYIKESGTGNTGWTGAAAGAGDVTAASTFGTDNRIIRSDGTGKGVQASSVTLEDNANSYGWLNMTNSFLQNTNQYNRGWSVTDGGVTNGNTTYGTNGFVGVGTTSGAFRSNGSTDGFTEWVSPASGQSNSYLQKALSIAAGDVFDVDSIITQGGTNQVHYTNRVTTGVLRSAIVRSNAPTISNLTLLGTTLDATGSGITLKMKSYIYLKGFDLINGATVPNTNDLTAGTFMKVQFSNSADEAANYAEWHIQVPDDIDTAVEPRAKVKFKLTGADTGTQRYVISMASVADSAAFAGTVGTAINMDFAGDASGASGDVETVGFTTLTGWGAAVTAGRHWVIRLARDGNATQDGSTVDSMLSLLVLEYGVTQ